MSYIQFDKTKLINLEYSLSRELIRSNRSGAYASTTIVGCNTRKYHGLLVLPQPQIDHDLHVLLSSLDETVIQHNTEFNLGLRKYSGNHWQPKGHKYIRDFESDPIPTVIYRVGGVVLKKETLLATKGDQALIRYTLLDAHSPTTLKFHPFLAFRSRHALSQANIYADTSHRPVKNGISMRLYAGYSRIFMQFSKEPSYVHFPNWYYNVEYIKEQERGYPYVEDLFVPGFFEIPISKGESFVFSAGLQELNVKNLHTLFQKEIKLRIPRSNFENTLVNSAQQFVVERDKKTEVVAGYPWYGRNGRATMIALPGLTLETGNARLFRSVMKTMIDEMKGPFFPLWGHGASATFHAADTPLWFFWTIQEYIRYTADYAGAWKSYGKIMKIILEAFLEGPGYGIHVNNHGLIEATLQGTPLTWMDAVVDGKPVTPRYGMPVEMNALWYNALAFYVDMWQKSEKDKIPAHFSDALQRITDHFIPLFWNRSKRCLYDVVHGEVKDDTIRPNQIFAVSLPYSLLSSEQIRQVLDVVKSVLLTVKGIRSLTPYHKNYHGDFAGNATDRDRVMHNGAVWPWLIGPFCEAWLKIYGTQGLRFVEEIFSQFENEMDEDGIGTLSELYNGNPPHAAGGAVSYAMSVAELLRINGLIKGLKQQ